MKTLFKRWSKDRSGAAALEMGMMLPFFLLSLFPPLEFARYSYAERILISSVTEGAKYAALTQESAVTAEDIRDHVIAEAGRFAPSRELINVTYSPDNAPGSRVTVSINTEFATVVPAFGTVQIEASGTRTIF